MSNTLAHTAEGRMPYFPALDGVRAFCILLVMFDHLKAGPHKIGWLDGHLGVDIFFVLSGFLITTLLLREQALTGRIDLKAFLSRRVFRIAPVYLAVLALYIAVCHLPGQHERWLQLKSGLPWFLTMMNEYAREVNHGNVFTHTWSLGVEEKFYLLWPLLFFVFARSARAKTVVLALLFAVVAAAPLVGEAYPGRAYFGLLMGCVMAIALASRHGQRIQAAVASLPATLVLAFFLAALLAEHWSGALMLVFTPATVLLLTHLLARPSWLQRVLSLHPLVWLGKRSYSMYLVHVLALNVFESKVPVHSGWGAGAVLVLAYLLAALVAEALYRAIESPARNAGRRWLARRGEVSAAV